MVAFIGNTLRGKVSGENFDKSIASKNYNISYFYKICGSLNLQRAFSVNNVVMDSSNIVLWVSVNVRNMNVTHFTLAAF